MQIFVKLSSGRQLTLEVEGSDSVESLKAQIFQQHEAAHPALQSLYHEQRPLEDGRTLAEYGLARESELQLGIQPPSQTMELCVGGVPHLTTLNTLL